jgi:putative acetyltransferase
MKIREEKERDLNQITKIHNQAFNGRDEGKIVKKLRKNRNLVISLVCELQGKLVGHIAYSPIYNSINRVIDIGLAPVGVLPGYQRQGIGSELIKEGNSIALSKGYKRIFVLGDPEYYRRFGFELAKNFDYYSRLNPDGNQFMVMGKGIKKEGYKIFVNYSKEFNL